MLTYIIRRLLLIIPTLLGVMLINFAITEAAPGGPLDQARIEILGLENDSLTRISGGGGDIGAASAADQSGFKSSATLGDYKLEELRKRLYFDLPWYERYWKRLSDYATFDFGKATFRDEYIVDLIIDKFPVSLSLGFWSLLITYLIAIPLGIRKALGDGTKFDFWTSIVLVVAFALPAYLVATTSLTLLAGGKFLNIFPTRGLTSIDWAELSLFGKIADYFWHLSLPLLAMILASFAGPAQLTKNFFIDQIRQQYVLTARAKGLTEHRILYGHVFRNAMILILAGLPAAIVGILFSSSLLIEVIFNLDGLGRLGYEAIVKRDFNIIFATLYFFTLFGLVMAIISDIMLTVIDPRIDFEASQ